jgi:hypothetical protein
MARPRKTPVPAPEPVNEAPAAPEQDAATGDAPVRRRRRRRTATAPDYAAETVALVEAALKSRGSKGATQETLQSVISWARTVRAEGEELKTLQSRPRRQKNQPSVDRLVKYEMNRALLDGILAGAIVLDVQEDGELLFLHGDSLTTSDPVVVVAEVVPEETEEA